MSSDEDLFLDGRDSAMTQLVGRFERPLFRFLLHLTGDAHLAEDLFQETFLRLHRARATYHAGEPLKPYLYRIALNAVRDDRTKHAREKTASLDGGSAAGGDGPVLRDAIPSASPEPRDDAQRAELRGKVRGAVAALPDAERIVVILRMFESLSFIEIAKITEVPVPTAKSRMLYALRRLRPVLEGYVEPTVTRLES